MMAGCGGGVRVPLLLVMCGCCCWWVVVGGGGGGVRVLLVLLVGREGGARDGRAGDGDGRVEGAPPRPARPRGFRARTCIS